MAFLKLVKKSGSFVLILESFGKHDNILGNKSLDHYHHPPLTLFSARRPPIRGAASPSLTESLAIHQVAYPFGTRALASRPAPNFKGLKVEDGGGQAYSGHKISR